MIHDISSDSFDVSVLIHVQGFGLSKIEQTQVLFNSKYFLFPSDEDSYSNLWFVDKSKLIQENDSNLLDQQETGWRNTISAAQESRWGYSLFVTQKVVRWGAGPASSLEFETLFSCRASDFAKNSLAEIAAHIEVFLSLRSFLFAIS